MIPDFNKKTADILAQRAAYKCSNPDCRVNTIGPNSDADKSIKIGEAAHIYGARIGSKRFNPDMTDTTRAEITNSIWLCRNCHKLIDTDETKYSAEILFKWRENHEKFIASTLGNNTDRIVIESQLSTLSEFKNYPPIIKRIVLDKPNGWEWRLTAELMKYYNSPLFRKLNDLKEGLYLKNPTTIEADYAFKWIQDRLNEMSRIVSPAGNLLDRLSKSWGEPGKPGDIKEIHHVTKLFKEYLEHIISFEEKIRFVNIPDKYQNLLFLFQDLIGSQVMKLASLPEDLDEIVTIANSMDNETNEHRVIRKEFVFELPKDWEKKFNKELRKLGEKSGNNSTGCWTILIIITALIIMFSLF